MALIKCAECGKEISDKAKACIHCGCPIESKSQETIYMEEAIICLKCGYVKNVIKDDMEGVNYFLSKPCDKCNSTNLVHHTVADAPHFTKREEYFNYYSNIVGGVIDRQLYDKWQDEFLRISAEYDRKFPPTPECPYCKSSRTNKISGLARMASTGFFGLGSKKIGKQWHCNKCGSDF